MTFLIRFDLITVLHSPLIFIQSRTLYTQFKLERVRTSASLNALLVVEGISARVLHAHDFSIHTQNALLTIFVDMLFRLLLEVYGLMSRAYIDLSFAT